MARLLVDNLTQLADADTIELSSAQRHYLTKVLRARVGDFVELFDGEGARRTAQVAKADKRDAELTVTGQLTVSSRPAVSVTLVQALARGDRMDWIVEKATELGVSRVVPVLTQRSAVNLSGPRAANRHAHWLRVATAACMQCGQDYRPIIEPLVTLDDGLALVQRESAKQSILLADPQAQLMLVDALADKSVVPRGTDSIVIVVGPESGLDANEIDQLTANGARSVSMGLRVLRTETAAVAAIAVVQALSGDWRRQP